jgi:hypothetical protein
MSEQLVEEAVDIEEPSEAVETVENVAPAEEKAAAVEEIKNTKTLLSDDGGDGEEAGNVVVPETYDFVAPEGYEVNDHIQAQLDTFSVTAKEAGLSQEQYQTVVHGEIERVQGLTTEMASAYDARINAWADITKADPVLGGEDLAKNLGQAKSAMDKFGTPELRKLFESPAPDNPEGLGIGNHPEVIRLLHRVGGMLSEDDLIGGGDEAADPTDGLKRMYPSMFND